MARIAAYEVNAAAQAELAHPYVALGLVRKESAGLDPHLARLQRNEEAVEQESRRIGQPLDLETRSLQDDGTAQLLRQRRIDPGGDGEIGRALLGQQADLLDDDLDGTEEYGDAVGQLRQAGAERRRTLTPAYALDGEGDLLAVQTAQLEEGVVVAGRRRGDEQVDGRL